jgi:hypothetical protein
MFMGDYQCLELNFVWISSWLLLVEFQVLHNYWGWLVFYFDMKHGVENAAMGTAT